ncbi:MAG: metallophosphoesterase [Leptothrix sp. (in: b-proteobacteria)]
MRRPLRIQLLSDLHFEANDAFEPQAAPGADLLVLAGDIGSHQPGSKLLNDSAVRDFGLGRFSPLRPAAPWSRVLYVPGNHEYDALPHAATRERLRAICAELGITWLDREVVELDGLDGVRFIGCTLWSDFDALASDAALALKAAGQGGGALTGTPNRKTVKRAARAAEAALSEGADSLLTRQLQARDKAFRAADFYLRKNTTLRADGTPLLAESMRELGLADQAWLREALATPFDGRSVVVTHFAPSLRSADPRYGLVPGTAGFCNALDALLPQADLWLHGHLHCPVDYTDPTPPRHCRVVANPLGYAGKGEQAGFVAQQLIELA